MSQSHASCQLDEPEINWICKFKNPKSKIKNPKLKWLRQDLNPQLQDSNSCALIPLSYEAILILVGTRGFEPPTCSFAESRANSIAPRPRKISSKFKV